LSSRSFPSRSHPIISLLAYYIPMAQEPTPKTPAKAAEASPDEVEKFLNEQKALEAHRQELIKELLREKEAAIKSFDEKLAKLGYEENHRPRRSHHKKTEDKKS
jgi:hypothetical protein